MAKKHKIPKVVKKNKISGVLIGALGLFIVAIVIAYGASILAVVGTLWITFKLLKYMFIGGK